jgi:uroporphyrin-III C-methyltransferase/precorrin-2 dehydrogenase/sirohydrochlorin ferrochelatase
MHDGILCKIFSVPTTMPTLIEQTTQSAATPVLCRQSEGSCKGKVWLVGTGPGDPDLLTVKAHRLIRQADIVLYDNLVSAQIMTLLPTSAERVYVGKKRSAHAMAQDLINQRLIDLAQAGRHVLRLKGGDPFIFGRGSEELTALSEAQVPFEVVPGITAAIGAAAYAGIPLTDRRFAQQCTLVTGQLKDGTIDLDWVSLSRPNQTLAIYMGLVGLPVLCRELMAHGKPASTPVAVIQQGTTLDQRVLTGTLGSIVALVQSAGIVPPTLVLVGEVVGLHQRLRWFCPNDAA